VDKLKPMTYTHTDPAIILTASEAFRRKSIKKGPDSDSQYSEDSAVLYNIKIKVLLYKLWRKKWNAISIHLF
jgi:hypothetical protein